MSSVEQEQWQDVCEAVRAHLAQRILKMPEMTLAELKILIDILDTTMWIETKACSYDEAVARRRREGQEW